MPQLEVWFQRASDVVRKLSYGDFDLGIVGLDMFAELSHGDPDLVVVHDALDFGHCHLGLGVPMGGKFADISTLIQLRSMPEWSESNPLRVVTGYQNVARKFFQEQAFEHVVLLSADGALEAAPLMGSADIILDLVSTGDHLANFLGRVEPVLYRFSHSLLMKGYALSTAIWYVSHMHWSVAMHIPHEMLTIVCEAHCCYFALSCNQSGEALCVYASRHKSVIEPPLKLTCCWQLRQQASHFAGAAFHELLSRIASPLNISSKLCASTAAFSFHAMSRS